MKESKESSKNGIRDFYIRGESAHVCVCVCAHVWRKTVQLFKEPTLHCLWS